MSDLAPVCVDLYDAAAALEDVARTLDPATPVGDVARAVTTCQEVRAMCTWIENRLQLAMGEPDDHQDLPPRSR